MKKNNFILRKGKENSFLFWLVVPIILVWLSVGYITGLASDKPAWFLKDKNSEQEVSVVPYFQDHGDFSENLDQPFVTLWFDDAWLSQYIPVYKILNEKNFPGTIAVPVNAVDTKGYMNWEQLVTVQKNGWEITNHSLAHDCAMDKWDRKKVEYEFQISRLILWKNNLESDILVTPCGVDSKIMREEAKKLFIGYRTVDPGYNDPKNINIYNLKVRNIDNKTKVSEMKSWIDYAVENKMWAILVFHKIGERTGEAKEDEFNTSVKDFQEIVNYINSKKIKVVVPSQIIASQSYEK